MNGYETKKDDIFNKKIDEVTEQKLSRLVNTQDMPENQTNWHRGYIACARDIHQFYNTELKKKANEA